MTDTKTFHIGDVLSITTGKLVSPEHIGGVYKICDWMTGQSNFTHQLPRVSREIEPDLRRQHPGLASVEAPEFDGEESVFAWLETLYPIYGERVEVSKLADPIDHTSIDPVAELKMMRPDAEIVVVNPEALS